MKKQQGFNLLECLLVLVVIAAVSLISIHRYRSYQQHIQLATIKNDIATIRNALNRYYRMHGCRLSDGQFAGQSVTPSLGQLGLTLPGRPPLIPLGNAYHAELSTVQKGTDKDHPYLYALKITADFSSGMSAARMAWYQKALGAQFVAGNRLIWQTMPNLATSNNDKKMWVINSQAEQFRRMENNNETLTKASPSYCAH